MQKSVKSARSDPTQKVIDNPGQTSTRRGEVTTSAGSPLVLVIILLTSEFLKIQSSNVCQSVMDQQ